MALVSGFWGQNIGNAFFNVGGKWVLDQVFGAENVAFIQDQPGYRTFNNQSKGNPRKDIGLLRQLDVDFIVLQGPMLTESFPALWRRTFEALMKRGTRIILLSAAFFRYTDAEKARCQEFLREFPPSLILTRNSVTYETVAHWGMPAYNGIDSGFFVSDAYQPFNLCFEPYIAANFDRYPEPNFFIGNKISKGNDGRFECLDRKWSYQVPGLQKWFSRKGKWQSYIGALMDRRALPERLDDYLVVRPEHRFNPHITWKIYKHPNAIASDEPFTYFNIYAGASLTLADRVHACVATLAYGKPAMLFTPSPRAALFERVGLGDIRRRPVTLGPDHLRAEKERQLSFLITALQEPRMAMAPSRPRGRRVDSVSGPSDCRHMRICSMGGARARAASRSPVVQIRRPSSTG